MRGPRGGSRVGRSRVARRRGRPRATAERRLEPNRARCWSCGGVLWVAYHSRRRLTLLDEVVQLTLVVRRCRLRSCARYRRAVAPGGENAAAVPPGGVWLPGVAAGGGLRPREICRGDN